MKTRCGTPRCFSWIRLAAVLVGLMAAVPTLAAQLTLTWTDNADNESGFRIERRLNPTGSYSEITTLGPNVTSYADTTVAAGQGYCYRLRAYNAEGNSGYSNEACGTAATLPSVVLTVVKVGTGTVTSTSPASAINCGTDCIETVPSGTPITLSASPGSGFVLHRLERRRLQRHRHLHRHRVRGHHRDRHVHSRVTPTGRGTGRRLQLRPGQRLHGLGSLRTGQYRHGVRGYLDDAGSLRWRSELRWVE